MTDERRSPYPEPPDGSSFPPEEFRYKMKQIDECRERDENENENSDNSIQNDSNNSSSSSPSFGMFSKPLFTWNDLPCSLHFANHANVPTSQARTAMKLLHDDLLGQSFGEKEGHYGAGGGGIHVLYLGRPPTINGADADADVLFPPIQILLDMLCLSDGYKPEAMKWMTTADPIHQHLFDKRKSEYDEEGEESTLSLDAFVHILSSSSATMDTRQILSPVPPHVTSNYPCLESGRVIFLLPRFSALHDGDCLSGTPIYCPTAAAFEARTDREEVWYQFQERPEVNIDVFIEESSNGGVAKEAGDVYESPTLALFQLATTGEIMALAQWDYRD